MGNDGGTVRPAPQLPPWVRRPRSVIGWIGLAFGVTLCAVLGFAVGILIVAIAIVAWAVRGVVWAVGTGIAWSWFLIQRVTGRRYPFDLRAPTRADARGAAINDGYLVSLPRFLGAIARVAAFVFAPLALLASIVGIVMPVWRARPYLALFTLRGLERKLVGLGRNRGFLRDGHRPEVDDYDTFLAHRFPRRADFLAWWRSGTSDDYLPAAAARPHDEVAAADAAGLAEPARFSGLALGPYPDPLGELGLALTAMRRERIGGLRDLFVSQREIDDLGDPNLDDRADAAVIRVSSREGGDGIRRHIVQLPSTQTWHPRAGSAPNDITADLVALSGAETTLVRAALEVMGRVGIGADDAVLLAGFSLGGLTAAQLIDGCRMHGYRVTHLISAGAPIGRGRVSIGSDAGGPALSVLSIEHVLDAVPRLDGRENPIRVSTRPGEPQWVTVKAGPPLPRGFRLAVTHHSPSYAETAGAIESDPPDEAVRRFLDGASGHDGALEFFGPGQQLRDFAATRAGYETPQAAVPLFLHQAVDDGVTRAELRTTLRRVPGVIAVDIYPSRTGFPTTILWSADVLVHDLSPWFRRVERTSVYRGLLSLLKREPSVGIHLRLQARRSPGVIWESTVQRTVDGRWREIVDVSFTSEQAERDYLPLLLPGGWMSRITYYPPDAFRAG